MSQEILSVNKTWHNVITFHTARLACRDAHMCTSNSHSLSLAALWWYTSLNLICWTMLTHLSSNWWQHITFLLIGNFQVTISLFLLMIWKFRSRRYHFHANCGLLSWKIAHAISWKICTKKVGHSWSQALLSLFCILYPNIVRFTFYIYLNFKDVTFAMTCALT